MCRAAKTAQNGQGNRYYYGKNILGTSTWVDIERTYDMTRSIGKRGSTENLTTHMQVDKIDVDFGFMTNAGFVLLDVIAAQVEGLKDHILLLNLLIQISNLSPNY